MIYYNIQHHGSQIQTLPLAPLFAHPKNVLSVSLDTPGPISPALRAELEALDFAALRLTRTPKISWGGASIMDQMIAAMREAVEEPGWRYFANLSGQCIPLKSQEEIFRRLNEQRYQKGWRGYCFAFRVRKPISWLTGQADTPLSCDCKYGRVRLRTTFQIGSMIQQGIFDPARRVLHRPAALFHEIDKNLYELRPLNAEQIKERTDFFAIHGFWAGRQWVILEREVVEWLVTSEFATMCQEFCRSIFIPDETFIQIALHSPQSPYKNKISDSSQRYRGGGPGVILNDELSRALRDETLIGRKVNPELHAQAIAKLLRSDDYTI